MGISKSLILDYPFFKIKIKVRKKFKVQKNTLLQKFYLNKISLKELIGGALDALFMKC